MNEKQSMEDYKLIVDLIKEMNEQYSTLKKSLENSIRTGYGLDSKCIDMALPYEKDEISSIDKEEIRSFLIKYSIDKDSEERYATADDETLIQVMNVIKDASLLLLSTKAESDKIKAEGADVMKEYFNYLSSEKVQNAREKKLETFKASLELTTDPTEKAKIEKMIKSIEASLNYSFLLERINKFGEKEIKSIKDSYFDRTRGTYIMDRFKEKITKFGFDEKLYRYFFNFEENFLPEQYSVFNNLFLFIYMRMVAYANPNDKTDRMLVQSATGAMANLVYHKFSSTENEENFIHVIESVLDNFKDYADYFHDNNTTYAEHPVRKEADARHEIMRKEALIKKMNELKITGYDESASADDLQKFFNDETDKLIAEQLEEKKRREEAVEEDEDDDDEDSTLEDDSSDSDSE